MFKTTFELGLAYRGLDEDVDGPMNLNLDTATDSSFDCRVGCKGDAGTLLICCLKYGFSRIVPPDQSSMYAFININDIINVRT